MQFLNDILLVAYAAMPELCPIVVFRMVRISINHGMCGASAFAFVCYGAWLVNALNSDYEKGYRMGKVALSQLSRLNTKEVGSS